MKNGLYNKSVFWTKELDTAVDEVMCRRYSVVATHHAFDKIEKLHLARNCYKSALHGSIVEAEVENGKVVKIVTRVVDRKHPSKTLCAAVMLKPNNVINATTLKNEAIVKTIWVNNTNDEHATIMAENYVRA